MRVYELFERLEKEMVGLSQSSKPMSHIHTPLSPKWKQLGYIGQQAAAYTHPDKNTVIKSINIVGTSDPVYQFLRMCTQHQDNPYFPKVYSMKLYPLADNTNKRFAHKLVITMERLHRLEDSMYPMVAQVLGFKFEQPRDIIAASRQLVQKQFGSPEWRKQAIQQVIDPKLKQALRLLEPLFRHYDNDMHLKNIMYRKGKNGQPELVFMDPIIDAKSMSS